MTPSAPTSANEKKRSGSRPAEHLVEQQAGELDQHQRVHLALARGAFAEPGGHLQHPQRRGAAQHEVQQDLEALAVQVAREVLEQRARQHEEAAHRVRQADRQEGLRQPDPAIGQHMPAAARQAGAVAALDVAAGDGEVVIAGLQGPRASPAGGSRHVAGRRRSPRCSRPTTKARPRSRPRPGRDGRSGECSAPGCPAARYGALPASVPSGLLSST